MANTSISYLKFGSTTYQINDKTALHSYTLPTASSSTKGGILIGYQPNNQNYPVQLDSNNKAYVNVPWTDTTYTIGGLIGLSTIGKSTQPIYWNGLSFKETSYAVNATVPATAVFTDHIYTNSTGLGLSSGAFSLNKTTASSLGGIIASNVLSSTVALTSSNGSTSSRYYGVQVDSTGKAFVNVPWTDTNTHPTFTSFTGKPTANTAPGFGGTFTISQISQNTSGQVSGTDRTVTIPNSTATTSANGLMTSAMVTKLNGIASGANAYSHPTYTSKSSGLYKITVDGTGHVSATTAVTKSDITGLGIPGSDTNTTYSASTGLSLSGTAFSLKTTSTYEIGGVKLGRENHNGSPIGDFFIPYYIGKGGDATNPENHYGKFSLQMFGADDTWANMAYIGIPTASTMHPGLMHQKYVEDLKIISNIFTNNSGSVTINSTNGNTSGKNYGVQINNAGKAYVNVPWTDNNTTYGNATTAAAGLMSASDKTKLNSIASNANAYSHPTYTSKSSGLYKITVDGTGHVSGATAVTKADITALGIPGSDTNTTYGNATTSVAGLMSTADKGKLDGIASGANAYSHPTYTAKSSGLYKITVDDKGHVSATTPVNKADITGLGIPAQDTTYSVFGGSNGLVPAATNRNSWEVLGPGGWMNVPFANSTYPGGIKIGFTQNGKDYPVQLNANDGKAYVNVPWTNTTYGASTGLSLSGTAFSLKAATSGELGGVKTWKTLTTSLNLLTNNNGMYVGLQSDRNGKGFINIPFVNTEQSGIINYEVYNSIINRISTLENQVRQLQEIINGGSY